MNLSGVDFDKLAEVRRTAETRPPDLIHPEVRVARDDGKGGYHSYWKQRLYFIVTESKEQDGRWWRHASVSRMDKKMPTYHDLLELKRLTVGETRKAIQVFPPASEYVNLTDSVQVLHLWACMDEDPLPDFTRGTGSL